jgi:hypothetical protein
MRTTEARICRATLSCFALLLVLGCTTPNETIVPTPDAGTPPPGDGGGIDAFYDTYARAICGRLFDCPRHKDDDVALRNVFGTEARCVKLGAELLRRNGEFDDVLQRVAEGTVRYDASLASACFAALRRCGAPVNLAEIGACRDMFEGQVSAGDACYADADCAGDAYCASASDATFPLVCPGMCRPRKTNGASCFFPNECAASKGFAACRSDDAGTRCVDYTLAASAPVGQPCGFLQGETLTPCGSAAWCDGTIGTCRPELMAGAACASQDDVCVVGFLCGGQDGGAVCGPMPVGKSAGDACGPASSGVCDPFLSLSCIAGTCTLTGDGAVGSPCRSTDFGQFTCQAGLACASTTHVCKPIVKAGEPCEGSAECQSRSCTGGVCNARHCDVH